MGVTHDIKKAVASMIKHAYLSSDYETPGTMLAWSNFLPDAQKKEMQKQWAPGGDLNSIHGLGSAEVARGIAKGLKEAIPGTIDSIGTGFGYLDYGQGKYLKEYVSDPIRRKEMDLGGNAISKMISESYDKHNNRLINNIDKVTDENGEYTPEFTDYMNMIGNMRDLSDVVSAGTELGATFPAYSKAIGLVSKGTGLIGNALKSSKIGKIHPKTVGVASKIPSITAGYYMFGGPDVTKSIGELGRELAGVSEYHSADDEPNWAQYASPDNTVSTVSNTIN